MEELHPEARFIVETLVKEGHIAYYAGGWVRDLLLQFPSDDIDIATNATPQTVQKLFPKTVPIGLSFGIILVIIDQKQFEVATFRTDLEYKDGRRPTEVAFTSAEEDAKRRDFTINGMFYDPIKDEILDFVGGKDDLKRKLIRAIGDPHERIKEDRLRMIRAVRYACRFQFHIHPETEKAIRDHSSELFPAVAIERVCQEFTKMTLFPGLQKELVTLQDLGLLPCIFPELKGVSPQEIEKRVYAIEDYPKHTPVIAYIFELFPGISLEKKIELCKYLKLSNQDVQFAIFLHEAQKLGEKTEKIEWAYFYANALSRVCMGILAAHVPIQDRPKFIQDHVERKNQLKKQIDRIKNRNPVVTSSHLKELGIQPGKKMGELLQEAEKVAIDQDEEDASIILKQLKLP